MRSLCHTGYVQTEQSLWMMDEKREMMDITTMRSEQLELRVFSAQRRLTGTL